MVIEVEYEVKKIIFRNIETGFTIANVKIKKHPKGIDIPTSETIIRGRFKAIHIKDEFLSIGYWKDYGKNGYQFHSETAKVVIPETDKGIVSFLHKFTPNLGITVAKRIVEKYGSNTLSTIRNSPECLKKIRGMTDKKIEGIYKTVTDHRDFEEVAFFLMSFGLNYTSSSDIYEKFGYSSIQRVRENPYILTEYTNIPFKVIDKIAYSMGLDIDSEERIKHGIMHFISMQMKNKGDIYVLREDILNQLTSYLGAIGHYPIVEISHKLIKDCIKDLIVLKKIKQDYNQMSEPCIYFSFYHHIEVSIVDLIKKLIKEPAPAICFHDEIQMHIAHYEKKIGLDLANKQRMAIETSIRSRISILTGGPGTGKTHTINATINVMKSINPNIVIDLCAPTGRAAKRMTEMTNLPAQTIHRLIGLNGFDENPEELMEIVSDVLIIDESSMIDAYVFYSLLKCVSETTRIIIVGDHEQLPSVGPGLILRDLIDTNLIPVTVLDEIFRQAQDSQIVMNSHKLIKGFKTTDQNGIKFNHSKNDFYFIEKSNKEEISNTIIRSVDRLLKRGEKLDNIQVLSVMNKGDLGVIELNRKIQKKYNKSKNFVEIGQNMTLKEGDRVMHTTNNYDLNVFNGEIGKISSINDLSDGNLELVVDYTDRDVVYTRETISELTLAYAMTVHKSQGSEFKNVIIPIHSSLEILLSRNIVYTGLTRAKERVVLVGSIEELNKAVDRVDNTIRNSMIKERLIRELGHIALAE